MQDNGPGIPADEVDYRFEWFYRASDVGSEAGSGHGLAHRNLADLQLTDIHRAWGEAAVDASL